MTTAILKAVRDALLGDATLIALLGGNHIYMSEIKQAATFPAITLRLNNEGSKKRVGYNAYHIRDNDAIIQIDIWSKSSRYQTYQIAERTDVFLMLNTVSGTRSWLKIGDGDMYEEATEIYHKPIRYSFEYTITDT